MAAAVQRIVVQATTQDKKAIAAKAKKLDIPISELMRRGAFAYESSETDEELGVLASISTDQFEPRARGPSPLPARLAQALACRLLLAVAMT